MRARQTVGGHPAGPKLVKDLEPPPSGPGPGMGARKSARKRALNLGSGRDIRPSTDGWEWINLDIAKIDGVDVVHDLDVFPWPFGDASFDAILADDIWEHVDHPLEFMAEVHRVLRVGGQVKIRTCQANADGFRDPTHKRWATGDTFDYWVPGTFWNTKYPHYANGRTFRRLSVAEVGTNLECVLEKL